MTPLPDTLKLLGLHSTAAHLDDLVALATKRRWSPTQLLEHLVDREQQARAQRTSSARHSTGDEIVRPSAFAVFLLITSSKRVARSTGRSAGLAPLRILSTKTAPRRHMSRLVGEILT
jgi:hypothetical protein